METKSGYPISNFRQQKEKLETEEDILDLISQLPENDQKAIIEQLDKYINDIAKMFLVAMKEQASG